MARCDTPRKVGAGDSVKLGEARRSGSLMKPPGKRGSCRESVRVGPRKTPAGARLVRSLRSSSPYPRSMPRPVGRPSRTASRPASAATTPPVKCRASRWTRAGRTPDGATRLSVKPTNPARSVSMKRRGGRFTHARPGVLADGLSGTSRVDDGRRPSGLKHPPPYADTSPS